MEIKKIAVIRNGFEDKFGIPRQSGLVEEVLSKIVFEKEYRNDEALRGIEEYSHLWLLWIFSDNTETDGRLENAGKFNPTVRPPRLGGNKRMGVFATRSPFRPNNIGLSSVKLIGAKKDGKNGTVLIVSGADLESGTPIIDIKPYIKYTDSHPDAISGFADDYASYRLEVVCPEYLSGTIGQENREAVMKLIACDPRPSYQNDPERIYRMDYCGYKISFKVDGTIATVVDIENTDSSEEIK